MKNKFERLSKRERKEAIIEFQNVDEKNSNLIRRLKRLRLIGIIGIIYAVLMFLMDFLNSQGIIEFGLNIFGTHALINYIVDACLLIFCVFFLVKANQILKEQVNKYLVEQMRAKDKSKPKKK